MCIIDYGIFVILKYKLTLNEKAFVQDLLHLYNALDSTEDNAVFNKNIPEEKKSEDEEMDDELETDSEEADEQ